jgi:hypothetical protein
MKKGEIVYVYNRCNHVADLPGDDVWRIPDELARKGERKESRSIS